MTTQTKTSYSEVPAADVAAWFVNGYKLQEGERLTGHEFFYDAHKGVFVFKLITEQGEQPAQV